MNRAAFLRAALAAGLAAALATCLPGCGPSGPHRDHVSLSRSPGALRDAFNADSGKVRVVVLASPT